MKFRLFVTAVLGAGLMAQAAPALAQTDPAPEATSAPIDLGSAPETISTLGALDSAPGWVVPAAKSLASAGGLSLKSFSPNKPMDRSAFKKLMSAAFGGGFTRTKGLVTAREVDAALVRKLGKSAIAKKLATMKSPDGWDPGADKWFGTEIVAREMGLRHDRPTSEERYEASAAQPITQADAVYAVWKAKTSPSTWAADELAGFSLPNLKPAVRKVVSFAFDQVGAPYVWGGDWPAKTPSGYPYGAQSAGGFDCSGFTWYALRSASSSWKPMNRPYSGWSLPERSSSDMAGATKNRLSYKELKPGDMLFFASGGRSAKASAVYHTGIYLGRGWMIDSAGGQDGVSLSRVSKGAWWHDQFVWGRRVIR